MLPGSASSANDDDIFPNTQLEFHKAMVVNAVGIDGRGFICLFDLKVMEPLGKSFKLRFKDSEWSIKLNLLKFEFIF